MLLNTRRRALGLILAAGAGLRWPLTRLAHGAEKECFDSKAFGPWKGLATNSQAGARMSQVRFDNDQGCDLHADVQVATSYDAKIVLYGDRDKIKLPKKFLIDPANRLMVRSADGKEAVNEPLCGNCTDIFDNKVSIVLPLATAPLFRESANMQILVKMGDKEECHLKLDCESLRKALDWAAQRQSELAAQYDEQKCTPPESGCFITTAACEVLGLDDDCFELTILRRYRDEVLAKRPGGEVEIARYYAIAPLILARMPESTRRARLLGLYARFILPAALAAHFGLNALAYRLYRRMVAGLARDFAPELKP
ncbi:CFI-box-CTERM domain-containing protein [Methyloceanibacter sp.]|uniref:CFI-box-CTERM domain-containing protein n=1 Tax=Methyloceanibacter sp. TaxID=1965321 RepID=UPI002D6DFEDD|nr:CFI-box-CTERM domain-containing protein [Methyloceanibacter sp.]HZP09899.1 CFI-box-CTERM domain-containing protein [Methyloceanibacter sp.]